MTPADWKKIQTRLTKLGYNPGPIDGIRGRKTTNAIKRFQERKFLVADGIVGPVTWRALFGPADGGETPTYDDMPWYDEAKRLIGTREISGSDSNEVILDWAEDLDIDYADDDIPWCGLFVAHCIGSTLGDEPLPDNPLGARRWMGFGQSVEPQLGSVLVFWRGSRNGWKGHVGFYHGEDRTHFHVLGGNQSNAVNVKRIPRDRLLGARWPISAGAPTGTTVQGGTSVSATDGNEQ